MLKRTVATALAAAALLGVVTAADASSSRSAPTATASTDGYLTVREARREIRARYRRQARRYGDYNTYLEIGPCYRYSSRRVLCDIYREYTTDDGYDFACEGPMQVIEFGWGWRTEGKGVDCDYD